MENNSGKAKRQNEKIATIWQRKFEYPQSDKTGTGNKKLVCNRKQHGNTKIWYQNSWKGLGKSCRFELALHPQIYRGNLNETVPMMVQFNCGSAGALGDTKGKLKPLAGPQESQNMPCRVNLDAEIQRTHRLNLFYSPRKPRTHLYDKHFLY